MNLRRVAALCRKESYQIVRDPSSILIAFILPVALLFILGYAVNLDSAHIRLGLLDLDGGGAAQRLAATLYATPALDVQPLHSRPELEEKLAHGKIRGALVIQNGFSRDWANRRGAVQLLTDGAEPNTANFVAAYAQGAWLRWQQAEGDERAQSSAPAIDIRQRFWFNPSAESPNFLVPGTIAIVMTIVGALLSSLVVAREWERGTMEALLATPVSRAELLLSKILPYYVLGIAAMLLCLLVAVFVMRVPFRGPLWLLWLMSSLFLANALGMGLFLSTVMRTQFDAAQAALTAGYLPALMLSGFVFEISSMPAPLQWLTRILPARYFASTLQTLFQAGVIPSLLWFNAASLILLGAFWLGRPCARRGARWIEAMWQRLLWLIIKELQALAGNRQGRLLLVVPVLLQLLVFPFAATLEVKHASLAVYNQDAGAASQELVKRMAASATFDHMLPMRSYPELRDCIDRQCALLAVVFPQDFSRALAAGRPTSLQVIVDGRRSNSGQIASAYIGQMVAAYRQERAGPGRSFPFAICTTPIWSSSGMCCPAWWPSSPP
ncbi:Inner membrane transport permease ybhS [Chromobacterium violaceum]|uniref:Inner membrane transport permease ybhS n=1 Tax=Chromobacterium violaceum TaxID=536 RepID=A0A3S4HRV5_CHRVL|nr:Inner membrane transport permease ybhS [Chromobacterium violaceum]